MRELMPKEFIQIVLINEVGEIHLKYPYISFATMSIGIEFLGKCLNEFQDWNKKDRSRIDFELAINGLNSLSSYRPLLTSHNLWDSLRNGFLHSFVPKNTICLSSKDEAEHLRQVTATKINLRCEDFYIDFKGACEEVINMITFPSTKMDRPLLDIPTPTETPQSNQSQSPPINNIQYTGGTNPTI